MWIYYKYYLNETFKQQESMFLCTYTECRWYLSNKIHGKFNNQTKIFPWEALMENTNDADKFRLPKKSKSKVLFYTSSTGNRRTVCSVSFKCWNSLIIGTRDVFSKTRYVIFDVIGKLKWVEEWRKAFLWCTVTRQQEFYQNYSVERVGSPSTRRCNNRICTGKIRFPL